MSDAASTVSIVTQTCVRPESAEAFARWQGKISAVISDFPGFIEQRQGNTRGLAGTGFGSEDDVRACRHDTADVGEDVVNREVRHPYFASPW